jgi:hypothetical protein
VVADLPRRVVRAKGLVRCVDSVHPLEVSIVGTRRTVRVRSDLALSAAGPEVVVIELVT